MEFVVNSCKHLCRLKIANNPISTNIRLFEKLVIASDSLESINDKIVTNNSRIFIRNKIKIKTSKKSNQSNLETDKTQTFSPKPIPHLPPYATQYR